LGIVSTKFRYRIECDCDEIMREIGLNVIVGGEDVPVTNPILRFVPGDHDLQCSPAQTLYVVIVL